MVVFCILVITILQPFHKNLPCVFVTVFAYQKLKVCSENKNNFKKAFADFKTDQVKLK